jgi:tRNA (cmo5U34)-methyltransferase
MEPDPTELERPECYEEMLQKTVPSWQMFYGTILEYVPYGDVRVLDLGCGTGFLLEMIREENPDALLTGIDSSPEMLAIARTKPALADASLLLRDFRNTWPEGSFDVVIMASCMFQIPRGERIRLIGRISRVLSEGGRFICGEMFRPENEWEEGIYRAHWRQYMRSQGLSAESAEWMIGKRDEVYDSFLTYGELRDMLELAGFSRILIPFTYEFYGVFVAFR